MVRVPTGDGVQLLKAVRLRDSGRASVSGFQSLHELEGLLVRSDNLENGIGNFAKYGSTEYTMLLILCRICGLGEHVTYSATFGNDSHSVRPYRVVCAVRLKLGKI